MFRTTLRKKRAMGAVLFAIVLMLFLAFNRFPKLDIIGEDLIGVATPVAECFQGFCTDREPSISLVNRWMSFSINYLHLVTVGMTFTFIVAGLAEAFLFPPGSSRSVVSGGLFKRKLQEAAVGPVMNLCSACIVAVSSVFHKRVGLEDATAMVQRSATMNIPALMMAFFVFTPVV
jgi:hypothetical protein